MKRLLPALLIIVHLAVKAQIPEAVYSPRIKTALLYPYGNQIGYPVMRLGGDDRLELHFDDLDGGVKNYSYTFQLCNADWTPAMLSQFDFLQGFSQVRINTYRVASVALTHYTHYQAVLPDRNSYPTKAGNYILKVFLNGDTAQLAFTRRLMIVSERSAIAAEVQQPFNGQIFNTHQKIQFRVVLSRGLDVANQFQQIKVVILQNGRWDNAITNLRPSFFSNNTLEYNTENDCVFPGGKEWRWLDLRSFRFQSDRVANANYSNIGTEIFVKPETDRTRERILTYRDQNGKYTVQTTESINPFWQGDYANVHFTFFPSGNIPFPDKDIYVFGSLSDYNLADTAAMKYNSEKGAYEKTLFLKQGFYDYCYATVDRNDPKRTASFEFTEGNYWGSDNDYMILVYYRPLAGRADELVGVGTVNSVANRQGLH